MLTEQEVRDRLRGAVEQAGGQRRFADMHGFTPAYVNDVVHGRRALADRILAAIGVERVVSYREKRSV
jgi:DNA-binding transcriptional regulator YdaS (Cro superfamily)